MALHIAVNEVIPGAFHNTAQVREQSDRDRPWPAQVAGAIDARPQDGSQRLRDRGRSYVHTEPAPSPLRAWAEARGHKRAEAAFTEQGATNRGPPPLRNGCCSASAVRSSSRPSPRSSCSASRSSCAGSTRTTSSSPQRTVSVRARRKKRAHGAKRSATMTVETTPRAGDRRVGVRGGSVGARPPRRGVLGALPGTHTSQARPRAVAGRRRGRGRLGRRRPRRRHARRRRRRVPRALDRPGFGLGAQRSSTTRRTSPAKLQLPACGASCTSEASAPTPSS